MKIFLTYPTEEGSNEIEFVGEKISFGRGSDADVRFADDGLSRLNSTIYNEYGKIWVLDENSTNGTFVNGEKVLSSGTPLKNGDEIKIGNYTKIKVRIAQEKTTQTVANKQAKVVSLNSNSSYLLPILITLFAVFVIGISASVIAYKMLSSPKESEIVDNQDDFPTPKTDVEENENSNENTSVSSSPIPKTSPINVANTKITGSNTSLTNSPEANNNLKQIQLPTGKKYQEMSLDEKRKYVEVKAEKVARMIGNQSGEAIPLAAVERIKSFLDAYTTRVNGARRTTCGFGDNMQSTLERAAKNAPFIIRAFREQGLDEQIGLYLAMVESEHCPCLVSPAQAKGLFQFLASTAKDFEDLQPPDKRCEPEPSAKAAAKYMKQLTGRIGTGPLSVPLAIGSYNSGQGALGSNLKKALEANDSQERSFWTLIANSEKLSEQFQLENVKYVPKFFAAAIIGENPNDFGMNMQPLSTYTK
ncbi:MAG: transglycosylase SLT domain-containing protein [Pyrinomonadaceae bacterium]|jgi:pSer/pThr/pTyr-binding forkhead associated (FHA) protein|nr:transglycosylase SLT domain-containing protein [Pyrinomonadaceae bacterium]